MDSQKTNTTIGSANGNGISGTLPSKPKRERSPNYPGLSLKVALDRTKQFYEQEKKQAAPANVAMQHWGFSAGSGSARVVLSTLVKFGLLDEEGRGDDRKVKLSRLALNILLDEQPLSPERDAAIKQAALKPKILAHLWSKYGNELPSEATIRTYLIRDLHFTDSAAGDLIRVYKDTIEFAKLGPDDTIERSDGTEDDQDNSESEWPMGQEIKNNSTSPKSPPKVPSGHFQPPNFPPMTGSRDLPITLPSLEIAVLRVPVPMSKEDYDALTNTLKAMEKKLVQNPNQGSAQGQ